MVNNTSNKWVNISDIQLHTKRACLHYEQLYTVLPRTSSVLVLWMDTRNRKRRQVATGDKNFWLAVFLPPQPVIISSLLFKGQSLHFEDCPAWMDQALSVGNYGQGTSLPPIPNHTCHRRQPGAPSARAKAVCTVSLANPCSAPGAGCRQAEKSCVSLASLKCYWAQLPTQPLPGKIGDLKLPRQISSKDFSKP